MTSGLTRRGVLGGMAASTGQMVLAGAPVSSPRPVARGAEPHAAAPRQLVSQIEALIKKANLGGDVGFALRDIDTGELLETRLGTTFLPPASTLKAVTALYALDKLGPTYRFRTELLATGPVRNGRLEGDLVLAGGGDPVLDTDRLADLAKRLREAGVSEVSGRFLVWAGAVPRADRIDANQPEHVSYNPSYSGINLNFNRVHFEWKRGADRTYETTMHARALRFSPATNVATMSIVERRAPVFDHWTNGQKDHWSVSRAALGKGGARWLPVRYPALYAGDVFRTLARSNGIVLGPAEIAPMRLLGQTVAVVESPALVPILQGMLKFSTNLTAEMAGLSASLVDGPVASLSASGQRMARFASNQGAGRAMFRDHSGLGYESAITPEDMVQILAPNAGLSKLLKPVNLSLDKARPAPSDVTVQAKTGSLNFVSTLAGFVKTASGRNLCFSIFTADTARRDAIPLEARENPQGAKGYARRSRQLQKELIRDWAARYP